MLPQPIQTLPAGDIVPPAGRMLLPFPAATSVHSTFDTLLVLRRLRPATPHEAAESQPVELCNALGTEQCRVVLGTTFPEPRSIPVPVEDRIFPHMHRGRCNIRLLQSAVKPHPR